MTSTDVIVDFLIQSSDEGHAVVMKANGHEVQRSPLFKTFEEAKALTDELIAHAKKQLGARPVTQP